MRAVNKMGSTVTAMADWRSHVKDVMGRNIEIDELDNMAMSALHVSDLTLFNKIESLITSYPR